MLKTKQFKIVPTYAFILNQTESKRFGLPLKVNFVLVKIENQFTVYYGISFDDKFEQQLAKIYFS